VLGIFFIKDIVAEIPQLISTLIFFFSENGTEEGIWTLVLTLLILAIYIGVSYCLIFKTQWIISKLQLERDFGNEPMELKLHRSTIISISIIVVGGVIIASEIPNFCRLLFIYLRAKRMAYGRTEPDFSYSILSAARILIGLLLLGNQRLIVNFIEAKRKK
jgi:hypothetical protein